MTPTRPAAAVAPRLTVALAAVIGLIAGVAAMFVVLRNDDEGASSFAGAPSVQEIDLGARSTAGSAVSGEEILEQARAGAAFSGPATEPASGRAALDAFLAAEVEDRSAESFALLATDAKRRYASVAAWRQSRSDRIIPQQFAVIAEGSGPGRSVEFTVRANRPPSITPFRGLVAAESLERWVVDAAEGGWRVRGGRPKSAEPQLPPDSAALAAAKRWVEATARCEPQAVRLQNDPVLVGAADIADQVCALKGKGTWSASAVQRVADVSDVTAFVAAFGPSVGRWGRAVDVVGSMPGGSRNFTVVLGPVGQEWRVLGLAVAGSG